MRTKPYTPLLAMFMLLAACSSEPGEQPDAGADGGTDDVAAGPTQLSGAVQKGPFVLGSSVDVAAVDATGNATGQVFSTQTSNDLGEFEVSVRHNGLASIEASGFYYNEVHGNLSSAELTLRSFANIQPAAAQTTYVNILTHLTYGRIATLLDEGETFEDARQQAESELATALGIGPSGGAPGAASESSILGGDTDPNAYLFAVSTVLTQAAVLRDGGSTEANLQELLNQYSADFAPDGQLDTAHTDEVAAAEGEVDTAEVEDFLAQRLQALGSSAVVPDLDRFIDTDGDDTVNADDDCVLDPTQQTQGAICNMSNELLVPLDMTREPYKWWAADFDGDGEAEIVTVAIGASGATLRYIDRDASGAFVLGDEQSPIILADSEKLERPQIFDYDEDGDLDIIAAHTGQENPTDIGAAALQNDGAGQFTQVSLDVPTSTWADGTPLAAIDEFTIVDLNEDDLDDLVVRSSTRVGVILAQQGGGWSEVTQVDLATASLRDISSFAVTDLDGDADLDVLIGATDELDGGALTGALFALINDGDGQPQVIGPFTDGLDDTYAFDVTIHTGDFNADGHTDAVLTNRPFPCGGQCTALMYGDGTGAFGTAEQFSRKDNFHDVYAGDFNGDAVSDLLVAGNQTDFLLGSSAGLEPGPVLELDEYAYLRSARVVDLNGDGRSDIVTIEDPTGGEPWQLRGWYFEGPTSAGGN